MPMTFRRQQMTALFNLSDIGGQDTDSHSQLPTETAPFAHLSLTHAHTDALSLTTGRQRPTRYDTRRDTLYTVIITVCV